MVKPKANSKNNQSKADKAFESISTQVISSKKVDISYSVSCEKCVICDALLEEEYLGLRCDICLKWMHGVCWDPDLPAEVCHYVNQCHENGFSGLRVHCVSCSTQCYDIFDLRKRLEAVEASISKLQSHCSGVSNTFAVPAALVQTSGGNSCSSNASILPQASSMPHVATSSYCNLATSSLLPATTSYDNFTEALDKERRKSNIIIFNVDISGNDYSETVNSLFEGLVGGPSPVFTCSLLGRDDQPKRPILVKFHSEQDKSLIMTNAKKLRNQRDKWPNVSIAHDRTKREQTAFKALSVECKARQARGERVLIRNYAIVHDRRPLPSCASFSSSNVQSRVAPATSPASLDDFTLHDSPLRVALPPLGQKN